MHLRDEILHLANEAPIIFKKNPVQRANALTEKISATIDYFSILTEESCIEVYDKVLHDIKPKLTALKEDENGNIFGDGTFKQPWIIDEEYQQIFKIKCNDILENIKVLSSYL